MALVKNVIILLALAAGASQQVVADSSIEQACAVLMVRRPDLLESNSKAAFDYLFDFVWNKYEPTPGLVVQAIQNNEECGEWSLNILKKISSCELKPWMEAVLKPIRDYAKKCLTPTLVEDRVRKQIGGKFRSNSDILSADFIKKYQAENGNEILDFSYDYEGPCCDSHKSYKLLAQTIEQDLQKRGRNAKREFAHNVPALKAYMKDNLFEPCTNYQMYGYPVMQDFEKAARYYEGGSQALVAQLSRDVQDDIFRFKYCLLNLRDNLVQKVAQSF